MVACPRFRDGRLSSLAGVIESLGAFRQLLDQVSACIRRNGDQFQETLALSSQRQTSLNTRCAAGGIGAGLKNVQDVGGL